MGFWHTGYMEFHEPVGLGESYKPGPEKFLCLHCGEVHFSLDELRKHKFEKHPLQRPAMFLRGRELGSQTVRVTQRLVPEDLRIEGSDKATLNGAEVPLSKLPSLLCTLSTDVCTVVLARAGVEAEFRFDICVASESDLVGVEEEFERAAATRLLDTRAVEEFISNASGYQSAIGYCDGICSYLYGVLAKERGDSSLPYDAYIGKFSKAAEELAHYDRPLARVVGGLIDFHFNHFSEAAALSPDSRVGWVAQRFSQWIRITGTALGSPQFNPVTSRLEALVTDWEMEQIIRWCIRPLHDLVGLSEEIEFLLTRNLAEFDKVKLHVLLTETYAAAGNPGPALKHAKALRNLASLEEWAEAHIRAHWEKK